MSEFVSEHLPCVVIVEADRALARLLHDVLSDDGCRAIICEDAADARQVIGREQPALVVLGLDLTTSKAAWTLLNHLRAAPPTAWLPILFVTADERLAREQGPLLRAEGYALLETPFDVDVLLELAQAQLRSGRRLPPVDKLERTPPP